MEEIYLQIIDNNKNNKQQQKYMKKKIFQRNLYNKGLLMNKKHEFFFLNNKFKDSDNNRNAYSSNNQNDQDMDKDVEQKNKKYETAKNRIWNENQKNNNYSNKNKANLQKKKIDFPSSDPDYKRNLVNKCFTRFKLNILNFYFM